MTRDAKHYDSGPVDFFSKKTIFFKRPNPVSARWLHDVSGCERSFFATYWRQKKKKKLTAQKSLCSQYFLTTAVSKK